MEDETTKNKLTFIQEWLGDLFAGEQVPDYEINRKTVDILYTMAISSQKKADAAKIAIEDIEQKREEYIAESKRMEAVSEWLGLSLGDLSPTAKGYLQSLASTALALDLGECSDTSLCLSLSELCRQRAKDEVTRREIQRERDSLQENLRLLLVKQSSQKRVLGEVAKELKQNQATTVAKQMREAEFLKQKGGQYHKLVSTLKDELNRLGYKPSLSHGSLQEMAKEVEELQTKLLPLKSQLASYQDLPPDLDLARVKIREGKSCLAKLDEEFSRTVDLVHTEK